MSAKWPAERTAALRRLVRLGLNDREIAERLGVSWRAVNGKRQRLSLPVGRTGQSKRAVDREARAENEQPWSPAPHMVKLRCERCTFWFAATFDQPWPLLCPDCTATARTSVPMGEHR